MTWKNKAARDGNAVDRAVDGATVEQRIAAIQARLASSTRRHATSCQCRDCIGEQHFRGETARLRAEHDAAGYASPPLGRWRRRI